MDLELKLQEYTRVVRKQRQNLNKLIQTEICTLDQDLQSLEQKTRRMYDRGMSFLNKFCTQVDKYLACLATQDRVVDRLLNRIRPIVSADVLEQAKRLRAATLDQQQQWYEAQDDLEDLQDALSRRQKRNARRGIRLPVDQVRVSMSLCTL